MSLEGPPLQIRASAPQQCVWHCKGHLHAPPTSSRCVSAVMLNVALRASIADVSFLATMSSK